MANIRIFAPKNETFLSDFQPLWQKLFWEDGAMACCTCLNILYVIVNTRKNIQLFYHHIVFIAFAAFFWLSNA